MAVAPPVPRLPYLPVSTPAAAAASLRRLGAAGGRSLSGGLYAAGSSGMQVRRCPAVSLLTWYINKTRKARRYTVLRELALRCCACLASAACPGDCTPLRQACRCIYWL